MTVTESELIISQNLDSKLNNFENKDTNLYKEVEKINNNLNLTLNNNEKPFHILNNIKNKPLNNHQTPKKEKPQFITTVKTGVFLEPPHEIATLLGLSKERKPRSSPSSSNSLNSTETVKMTEKPLVMYAYSSRPKILNNKNYHANCIRRKRSPDDYNEMAGLDDRYVVSRRG